MIGAISNSYIPYAAYAAQSVSKPIDVYAARRTSSPDLPVSPVEPVRPVREATDANKTRLFNNEHPVLREGADPVEMAVRMRIQYVQPQEEAAPAGEAALGAGDVQAAAEEGRCETCEKRKYQDESDDPGVSFQTPTNVGPDQAASAVRGHEQEHVVRERAAAQREDRRVVSQSVTYHTDICPECGRVYVSGGTTRTVTAANPEPAAETKPDQAYTPFSAVA